MLGTRSLLFFTIVLFLALFAAAAPIPEKRALKQFNPKRAETPIARQDAAAAAKPKPSGRFKRDEAAAAAKPKPSKAFKK